MTTTGNGEAGDGVMRTNPSRVRSTNKYCYHGNNVHPETRARAVGAGRGPQAKFCPRVAYDLETGLITLNESDVIETLFGYVT